MLPDEQFTFSFPPAEHKRLLHVVYMGTTGFPPRCYSVVPWCYALIVTLYAFQMVVALFRHSDPVLTTFYVLIFAAWLVIAVRRTRSRRLPVEGALRLTDAGLAGTLDNAPSTIRWADIATVRDLDGSIVFSRRHNLSPIAIPKSSIADVAAFWALLEDRLVSKRGLIRSVAPRTQIHNSAF